MSRVKYTFLFTLAAKGIDRHKQFKVVCIDLFGAIHMAETDIDTFCNASPEYHVISIVRIPLAESHVKDIA